MEGDVTVREIMTRDFVGVSESDSVEGAVELLLEEGASVAVVLRGSDPVGMLTADDALTLLANEADPAETAVGDVMSGTVPQIGANAGITQAAGTMADSGVSCVLVAEDDVQGIVSERDVVTATASLADRFAMETPREPEPGPADSAAEAPVDPTAPAADDEYSNQSVCEICGSLTPDLQNFNGQLVCADCRDI